MDVPIDFDRELEHELHRWLDPLVAAPIPPRTVPARVGLMPKLLAGAGAAVTAKLVMGFAIAALAAGAAGVATEAVITRSLSPVQWSQQAKDQVLALESQYGSAVNQPHSATSPAAHLAGASNGTGQQPATVQPAQQPQESPPPTSVAVPRAEPITNSKPTPPLCVTDDTRSCRPLQGIESPPIAASR